MGLHHATLKAAVLVYAALIGTMTEESLKGEIAKDERGFSPEEIDEIYAAVIKSVASTENDSSITKNEDVSVTSVVTQDMPEWVAQLLASNLATQRTNQDVIDSIAQFKELAGNLVRDIVEGAKSSMATDDVEISGSSEFKVQFPEYDTDAEYIVAKVFRDTLNFAKVYEVGDDVSDLGEDRIKHLLSTGNVKEA